MPELTITVIAGAASAIAGALLKFFEIRTKLRETALPQKNDLLAALVGDKVGRKAVDEIYRTLEIAKPKADRLLQRRLFQLFASDLLKGLGVLIVVALAFLAARQGGLAYGTLALVAAAAGPVGVILLSRREYRTIVRLICGPKAEASSIVHIAALAEQARDLLDQLWNKAHTVMNETGYGPLGAADEKLLGAYHGLRRLVSALEAYELQKRLTVAGQTLHYYLGNHVFDICVQIIVSLVERQERRSENGPGRRLSRDEIEEEFRAHGLFDYYSTFHSSFFDLDVRRLLEEPDGKRRLSEKIRALNPAFSRS